MLFLKLAQNDHTHIYVVNVKNLGVKLQPHSLGLLNGMCQLTVGL